MTNECRNIVWRERDKWFHGSDQVHTTMITKHDAWTCVTLSLYVICMYLHTYIVLIVSQDISFAMHSLKGHVDPINPADGILLLEHPRVA